MSKENISIDLSEEDISLLSEAGAYIIGKDSTLEERIAAVIKQVFMDQFPEIITDESMLDDLVVTIGDK